MTFHDIVSAALARSEMTGVRLASLPADQRKHRAVLENDVVAVALSFDWRDRVVGATFRTLARQREMEGASGLERLVGHDTSHSLAKLLVLRSQGTGNPTLDPDRPEEAIEIMRNYLNAVVEFAPDVLTGDALRDDQIVGLPPTIQVYRP